jgi:hypothetical protein
MKNKHFQILEIGIFQSLLVKFIYKTVKDTENLSIYCRNPFNNKGHIKIG